MNQLITDLNSEKQPDISRCRLIACIISGRLEEQVELLFWYQMLYSFDLSRRSFRGGSAAHRGKLEDFH